MKKIGFIDHYLHEWHADHFPKWIEEASGGGVKVCCAWGEIDNPYEDSKSNKQWCEDMGIEFCSSPEEVIEKSDYLIVLSPDNPERHEELCRLPLASGKPVYVDKTFAVGMDDATRIIAIAEKYKTPFFTCSSRRYSPEIQMRLGAEIELIQSKGPGEFGNYAIHQIEPAVCLMGVAAERVMAFGKPEKPTLVYEFSGGRQAVMSFFDYDAGFGMTLRYKDGHCEEEPFAGDPFIPFISEMLRFFETGIPPVGTKEALDIMAMIDAGRSAASRPGSWVNIL